MKRLFNHLIAFLSALAAIVAVVPILTSETMRAWVRGHSNWVYFALIVGALIAFLAVDYALSQNRRCQTLEASIKNVSDHDKELLSVILSQLPLDGEIMRWLRNRFFVKRMPARLVDATRDVEEQLSLHPVGFDNSQVNDAYKMLLAAIRSFDVTIATLAVPEQSNHEVDYEMLHVPLEMKEAEGGEQRYYAALEKINESVSALVGAYDGFLQTCQQNGMEIYYGT